MPWIYLILAGITEVVWSAALKQSAGFTRPVAGAVAVITMILSFILLAMAMRSLPLGTSYGVWTGIGAVGAAIIGIVWFGESRAGVRLGCIALIIVGIIGLKLTNRSAPAGQRSADSRVD